MPHKCGFRGRERRRRRDIKGEGGLGAAEHLPEGGDAGGGAPRAPLYTEKGDPQSFKGALRDTVPFLINSLN